jgi:hypothetical protein
MHRLKDILDIVAMRVATQFTHVNDGGCGVFALYVAKQIHGNINYRICASDEDPGCLETARRTIKSSGKSGLTLDDWADANIWFGHIFLELEIDGVWYAYDTTGLFKASSTDPTFDWRKHKGHLTLTELQGIANVSDGWNQAFNRNQMPKMKLMVSRAFEVAPSDLFV